MNLLILDSTPTWLLCQKQSVHRAKECQDWIVAHENAGRRIILPEIVDYEVRRELLRRGRPGPLHLLDRLALRYEFLPLQTLAMRKAAEYWAALRNLGTPTAGPQDLDIDVIIAAQAESVEDSFVIATSNVSHFQNLAPAEQWENIQP